jgi:hypothetical protein
MGGRPEGCLTGPRNTRIEETRQGQRRIRVAPEDGQDPEWAVVKYVDG